MAFRNNRRLGLGLPNDPVVITTSTFQIDSSHFDRLLVLNSTSPITVSLPKANGSGMIFTAFIGTSSAGVASNIIKRNPSTDLIQGSIYVGLDNSSSGKTFRATSTSNTVTLNGSTTGGLNYGDTLFFFDIAAGVWVVSGAIIGSGGVATPFSNT